MTILIPHSSFHIFRHREYVVAIGSALVVDRVHDSLHEVYAQTAYLSFVQRCFHIYICMLCGVEGCAVILDDQRQYALDRKSVV